MVENLNEAYSVTKDEKQDFYANNSGRKVGDFCLGFFGLPIIGGLVMSLSWILTEFLEFSFISWFFNVLYTALLVWAIIYVVKKKRRYVWIGLLSAIVIPLLFFGACLWIMMNSTW